MVTTKKPTRQERRKAQRDFNKSNSQQDILNKTLYSAVAHNGGTITVPRADLEAMPEGAQIKSMYVRDLDAVVITVGVAKPESKPKLYIPETEGIIR